MCFPCNHTNKILAIKKRDLDLAPSLTNKNKIAIDIDETLVYTSRTYSSSADAIINIYHDGKPVTLYIILRPYAREFVFYMSKFYDVYFYSASPSEVSYLHSMPNVWLELLILIELPRKHLPENTAFVQSMVLSKI